MNDIQALLRRHHFHFSKTLGQNFLIDPSVPYEIAGSSGADETCGVLEIGPGIGCLTVELCELAGRVAAVELDRSLFPVLSETLADHPNAVVVPGDVLKLDLAALVAEQFDGLTPMVCANLPYNITSPVLTALLESRLFSALTVMIQREVAKRICASPGTSDYGSFSLFCQYHADCELLFEVPPTAFLPAPKVTSAVLRMVPHEKPDCVEDEVWFFKAVRGGFALRRKTLLNSLASVVPLPKEVLTGCIERAGLSPQVRGETLGIPQFAALAVQIKKECVK